MTQREKNYTHHYRLIAAQCNAQRELAPAKLLQLLIEVATEHADLLGVGFRQLAADGNLWVLSRIAFEMKRYPTVLEEFSITTWVEGYNRHFSERNFELRGSDGEVIGYARSIWVAINVNTRRPANIDGFDFLADVVSNRPCPIDRQGKLRPIDPPQTVQPYRFEVSDIDVNRHVTSSRYAELIIDRQDLATYDSRYISRFEIEYRHEAHYGDEVEIRSSFTPDGTALVSAIMLGDTPVCLARSITLPRPSQR